MRPHDISDVIAKVPGVRKSGDHWEAPCPLPGHKTPSGHLTITDAGDKVLITDQGGRHSYKDFCQAWGFTSLAYAANGSGSKSITGKACEPVNTPLKQAPKALTYNPLKSVNQDSGLTLDTLAETKHLPVDFLKTLGLSDSKCNGQPLVKIPYYGKDGAEAALRYRLALTGDNRFRWRKGDHAALYGLNRLPNIQKIGWVLVVEGESDCWTGWYHRLPVLGAPGKGIWPVGWGEYLKGLQVFVWQEPEAEDFVLRVLKTAPDLFYIRAPENIKDISEAHIQGTDIPAWLEDLKAKAESGQALKARFADKERRRLYREAKAVIEADDPLTKIESAIRELGYGGDIKPTLIVYLAMTSRLLEVRSGSMPVHIIIIGPPSGGKSYTLAVVRSLMPSDAYHVIDAGSPRVLIYDEASLAHKALIFGEADSLPPTEDSSAASAVRNLLQDHHLHYAVTIRDDATGEFGVKEIDKPGPTVLITTSTRPLGEQLMTRFFTLEIGDNREQIAAALATQARLEIRDRPIPDAGLIAFQAYLQLMAPVKVTVPYAEILAAALGKMASAPRILRDFARLMSLIKAMALIRHHQRKLDSDGRIVAEPADYDTVRSLVNDIYIDSSTGANDDVRNLVKAVIELDMKRLNGERITNTALATHLNIGNMQALRRAKRALKLGWLVNREQQRYHPADYAPGEPMPEASGLPLMDTNTPDAVNREPVNASSFKNDTVNVLTALTGNNVPHPIAIADYPTGPCPSCGSGDYWLTDWNKWICSRCHPKPGGQS